MLRQDNRGNAYHVHIRLCLLLGYIQQFLKWLTEVIQIIVLVSQYGYAGGGRDHVNCQTTDITLSGAGWVRDVRKYLSRHIAKPSCSGLCPKGMHDLSMK